MSWTKTLNAPSVSSVTATKSYSPCRIVGPPFCCWAIIYITGASWEWRIEAKKQQNCNSLPVISSWSVPEPEWYSLAGSVISQGCTLAVSRGLKMDCAWNKLHVFLMSRSCRLSSRMSCKYSAFHPQTSGWDNGNTGPCVFFLSFMRRKKKKHHYSYAIHVIQMCFYISHRLYSLVI